MKYSFKLSDGKLNIRIFLASLKSYLDKQVDVFNDKDILEHMNGEVPLLVNIINSVKEFENTIYLPNPLVDLFNAILKLYMTAKKLSFERFVKAEDFLAANRNLSVIHLFRCTLRRNYTKRRFIKQKKMKMIAIKHTRKRQE